LIDSVSLHLGLYQNLILFLVILSSSGQGGKMESVAAVDTTSSLTNTDVQQYLGVILTLGSLIASAFATLLFRVTVSLGLARRLDVAIVVFVTWIVWVLFTSLVNRIFATTSRSGDAFATWINNCMVSLTAVLAVFIWFYFSDFLNHTALTSGISLVEAILVTLLAIMFIAAIVTFLKQFVLIEARLITMSASTNSNSSAKDKRRKERD
jgi:hypothetical protein